MIRYGTWDVGGHHPTFYLQGWFKIEQIINNFTFYSYYKYRKY